jgi:hypothetical protein
MTLAHEFRPSTSEDIDSTFDSSVLDGLDVIDAQFDEWLHQITEGLDEQQTALFMKHFDTMASWTESRWDQRFNRYALGLEEKPWLRNALVRKLQDLEEYSGQHDSSEF